MDGLVFILRSLRVASVVVSPRGLGSRLHLPRCVPVPAIQAGRCWVASAARALSISQRGGPMDDFNNEMDSLFGSIAKEGGGSRADVGSMSAGTEVAPAAAAHGQAGIPSSWGAGPRHGSGGGYATSPGVPSPAQQIKELLMAQMALQADKLEAAEGVHGGVDADAPSGQGPGNHTGVAGNDASSQEQAGESTSRLQYASAVPVGHGGDNGLARHIHIHVHVHGGATGATVTGPEGQRVVGVGRGAAAAQRVAAAPGVHADDDGSRSGSETDDSSDCSGSDISVVGVAAASSTAGTSAPAVAAGGGGVIIHVHNYFSGVPPSPHRL
jgi:hypothetical protein